MKKVLLTVAVALASLSFQAKAFDLNSILGSGAGDVVSGLVDGLFTQSDITVAQMAGTWTATGSAVCFQSENYLKKAGGAAVASTIESKLNPYYKQYGLTGSVLTVDSNGKFSLKVKSLNLSGTVTKAADGNFEFAFTALGGIKVGTLKTYVEKTPSGLNVMFDASKLKTLLTTITTLTGSSLAKTAGSLLESYDGLCVGFAFAGDGSNSNSSPTNILDSILNPNSNSNSNGSKNSNNNSDAVNTLKNIFGK